MWSHLHVWKITLATVWRIDLEVRVWVVSLGSWCRRLFRDTGVWAGAADGGGERLPASATSSWALCSSFLLRCLWFHSSISLSLPLSLSLPFILSSLFSLTSDETFVMEVNISGRISGISNEWSSFRRGRPFRAPNIMPCTGCPGYLFIRLFIAVIQGEFRRCSVSASPRAAHPGRLTSPARLTARREAQGSC